MKRRVVESAWWIPPAATIAWYVGIALTIVWLGAWMVVALDAGVFTPVDLLAVPAAVALAAAGILRLAGWVVERYERNLVQDRFAP